MNVHAQPGARRPQLRGMHGDAVKIAVKEAAQDGRANAAIIRFIAEGFDLPVADVELSTGLTSRRKRVFLHGNPEALTHKLEMWLGSVHTNSDRSAAAPNEASQGARREVW